MDKKWILCLGITLLAIFLSCKSKTLAKFDIINQTDEHIESLYIIPDNANNKIQINPNTKVFYNIDMTNFPKVDGCYGLSFKTKTKEKLIPFGYYTNGNPLESMTTITIQSDTVLIKNEYKDRY